MDRWAEIEAIIPAVRAAVYRVFHRLPPHVDREDLLQEGLLRAFHDAPRWDPLRGTFEGFVIMQAIWGAREFMRDQRAGSRTYPAVEAVTLEGRPEIVDEDSELTVPDLAWERRLWAAVDSLPYPLGATFRLYVEAELSMEAIGRLEGVTDSAISLRLKRAREILGPRLRPLL